MSRPPIHGIASLAALLISAAWLSHRRRKRRKAKALDTAEAFVQLLVGSKPLTRKFSQEEIVTVGRRSSNLVYLSDTGVSSFHFKIQYNADEAAWQLVDLGSLNGTTVNRILLSVPDNINSDPYTLCTGDKILVGERTVLRVLCHPTNIRVSPKSSSTSSQQREGLVEEHSPPPPKLPVEVVESLKQFHYPEIRLKGCSIQKQGSRPNHNHGCEDTFSHFTSHPEVGSCAFCLCDGHCGGDTSSTVQSLLPGVLADKFRACSSIGGLIKDAEIVPGQCKEVFLRIDESVVGDDGSTMSLVMICPNEHGSVSLVAANVGDSAVVCADFKRMMKTHLTDEHRVTNAVELKRLKDTGSILTHSGTRLMGLNLSRSIGDKGLKEKNLGFVAVPSVSKVQTVPPGESLVILLASDGLWDVTTTTIAVQLAYSVLSEHPGNLTLLAQVLMDHALKRRSRDDITIVVLQIEKETVFSNGNA